MRGSRHGQSTRRPESLPDEGQSVDSGRGTRAQAHGAHDDRIRTLWGDEIRRGGRDGGGRAGVGQSQPGRFECVRDRCPARVGKPGTWAAWALSSAKSGWWDVAPDAGGAGLSDPRSAGARAAAHLRSSRLRTPLVRYGRLHGATARVGTTAADTSPGAGAIRPAEENRQQQGEWAARHRTPSVSHKGCQGDDGLFGCRLRAPGCGPVTTCQERRVEARQPRARSRAIASDARQSRRNKSAVWEKSPVSPNPYTA